MLTRRREAGANEQLTLEVKRAHLPRTEEADDECLLPGTLQSEKAFIKLILHPGYNVFYNLQSH